MEMKGLSDSNRKRLEKLSTTNISDALDALGIRGSTYGIRPMYHSMGKIIGPAVTIKMTDAGTVKSKYHLGFRAIDAAQEGDVIVVDNSGKLDSSCWGGILANGAKKKGVQGVVIDGACRDVDDYVEIGFNVYARGAVVATARGRIQEEATNVMVRFAGVQVRPGDIVVGDLSGVVIIPQENLKEVIEKAEALMEKENAMIAEITKGSGMIEMDGRFQYEKMLKQS